MCNRSIGGCRDAKVGVPIVLASHMQTFNPQLQVILKKTVRARDGYVDRFQGAQAEIDLSPYLGETSTVTTQKGINQPAGGFTIRVGDRLYPAQRQVAGAVDSLYALVEPMDVIEIRMRRAPGTGNAPLVMRGLVSTVRESEAMGENGAPQRFVTIQGQDWGKWLQIIQIKYLRGQPVANLMANLTGTLLQTAYGISYVVLPAAEFVTKLINNVVNQFIGELGQPALPPLLVNSAGADANDKVFPQGLQANPQGTIWTYLQRYGNLGPFYEAFIDDDEAGPTLVYRKPHWVDLDGQSLIFPASAGAAFDAIPVPALDILSLDAGRADTDMANWFFVQSPRTSVVTPTDQVLQSLQSDTTLLSGADYANSAAGLYGVRLMEVETNHGAFLQGVRESESKRSELDLTTYLKAQIAYLKASNRDNVVLESGSLVVKGNPALRPGRHLEIDRRGLKYKVYATAVTQTFEPFHSYRTSVQFIRGLGFVERSKRDGSGKDNPYRAMIGRGAYS